jgi:hypothetical protein
MLPCTCSALLAGVGGRGCLAGCMLCTFFTFVQWGWGWGWSWGSGLEHVSPVACGWLGCAEGRMGWPGVGQPSPTAAPQPRHLPLALSSYPCPTPSILLDRYTFEQYLVDFGKNYSCPVQRAARMELFYNNLNAAKAHNARGLSWKVRPNQPVVRACMCVYLHVCMCARVHVCLGVGPPVLFRGQHSM